MGWTCLTPATFDVLEGAFVTVCGEDVMIPCPCAFLTTQAGSRDSIASSCWLTARSTNSTQPACGDRDLGSVSHPSVRVGYLPPVWPAAE